MEYWPSWLPIQRASRDRNVLGDALHPRTEAVVGNIENGEEEGPAVHDEVHVFGRDLFDELAFRIVLHHALAAAEGIAGAAETGAQVGDLITTARRASIINIVVDFLQVPIVDERHHHSKAVELPRADKGVFVPAPVLQFLPAVLALQTRLADKATL